MFCSVRSRVIVLFCFVILFTLQKECDSIKMHKKEYGLVLSNAKLFKWDVILTDNEVTEVEIHITENR